LEAKSRTLKWETDVVLVRSRIHAKNLTARHAPVAKNSIARIKLIPTTASTRMAQSRMGDIPTIAEQMAILLSRFRMA
jgi:hypothetical protein